MSMPEKHLFTVDDPELQLAMHEFGRSINELCNDDSNALAQVDHSQYKGTDHIVQAGFSTFSFSTPDLQKVNGRGDTKAFIFLPTGQPGRQHNIATVEARIETPGIGILGLQRVIKDTKTAIVMDPGSRPKNEGFQIFFQSVSTTTQQYETRTETQTTDIYEPVTSTDALEDRFSLLLGELAFYGSIAPNNSRQ